MSIINSEEGTIRVFCMIILFITVKFGLLFDKKHTCQTDIFRNFGISETLNTTKSIACVIYS